MHPHLLPLPLTLLLLTAPLIHTFTPNYPPSSHGYSILGVRQGFQDDCLLNNELTGDLSCWGFNNGPRDADNNPTTPCGAGSCDNNCKVTGVDGVLDSNGELCTKSCGCTPDCGNNDPGCIASGSTKTGSGGGDGIEGPAG